MRNIKFIIIAATLLSLLVSCENRFEVQTGSTPVEFTSSTIDVELNSIYNYIPVQMTENSELSSHAVAEFVGGTITLKEDGSQRDVVEGTDVIFTSLDLYIGAYDPEVDTTSLPNNNIEFRIPNYLDYESISLTLKLVGDNLGSITEVTWTATAPQGVQLAGNWSFNGFVLTVVEDENGNYGVQSPFATGATWSATRANNMLTITTEGIVFDFGADSHGESPVFFCAYHVNESDGKTYLWPDEACVLEFSDDGTVTATNGIFHGFLSSADGSYYNWNNSVVPEGTVGTRQ